MRFWQSHCPTYRPCTPKLIGWLDSVGGTGKAIAYADDHGESVRDYECLGRVEGWNWTSLGAARGWSDLILRSA